MDIVGTVRSVIERHARLVRDLGTVGDRGDLYDAGMTSHASVNVMLALEDVFGVEFPESLLRRETFQSVDAIANAISSLAPVG